MKAKEIEWSGLVASPEYWCYDGRVDGRLAYRIYDHSSNAGEYYFISPLLSGDTRGMVELEFQSVDEAKAECEADLARYVEWLDKQLQWLGEGK